MSQSSVFLKELRVSVPCGLNRNTCISSMWFEQNYVSQFIVVWIELRVAVQYCSNRTTCLSSVWFEQNYASQSNVVWTEICVSAKCGSNRTRCLSPMWFGQNCVSQSIMVWTELRTSVQRGLNISARTTYSAASGSPQQLQSPAVWTQNDFSSHHLFLKKSTFFLFNFLHPSGNITPTILSIIEISMSG